jgi:hypothetical protein
MQRAVAQPSEPRNQKRALGLAGRMGFVFMSQTNGKQMESYLKTHHRKI